MNENSNDPFVGTWKLNLAKSKFNPPLDPAPVNLIAQWAAQANGMFELIEDGVGADGKPFRFVFGPFRLDGKDYPLTGMPDRDVSAWTRIDANTYAWISQKGSREAVSGRITVSKDGKTLTGTRRGKDHIAVFDKQ